MKFINAYLRKAGGGAARVGERPPWSDRLASWAMGVMALTPALVLLGLLGYLLWSSWPIWQWIGWRFFTDTGWALGNLYGHPVTIGGWQVMPGATYGALVFIVGTALTSLLSLLFATPVAVMVAATTTFVLPRRWRGVLAAVVETMAGIPSVIFGLWGFTTVAPVVTHAVAPWLNRLLAPLPFFSGPVESQTNLLVAVVVLTLMIMPIIAATSRLAMENVSGAWVEGGMALGFTEWEVFRHVVWPKIHSGILGAMILGLGRALGETMAVLMVSGNALNVLPQNWYSPVSTMAATIAGQLDSALTDPSGMAVRALGALGLVLYGITVLANLGARAAARMALSAGPSSSPEWGY